MLAQQMLLKQMLTERKVLEWMFEQIAHANTILSFTYTETNIPRRSSSVDDSRNVSARELVPRGLVPLGVVGRGAKISIPV